MKVQIASDLHFEFHRDLGKSYIGRIDPSGVDVLILAGDIAMSRNLVTSLGFICKCYADSKVIYVHGNHEYYMSYREECHINTKAAEAQNPNLIWLHHDLVEIDGIRFLGTPLWFRDHPDNYAWAPMMNDFRTIERFESWVYNDNQEAIDFLEENLCEGDFVITHHLPTEWSIANRYKDSGLNRFFVCDMKDLILDRAPAFWVHGHTHDACDYNVAPHGNKKTITRVICNPMGYPREQTSYNHKLVIETAPEFTASDIDGNH